MLTLQSFKFLSGGKKGITTKDQHSQTSALICPYTNNKKTYLSVFMLPYLFHFAKAPEFFLMFRKGLIGPLAMNQIFKQSIGTD